ncbi:MAG: hypothetical protein ACQEP7_06460 [bacterium]
MLSPSHLTGEDVECLIFGFLQPRFGGQDVRQWLYSSETAGDCQE